MKLELCWAICVLCSLFISCQKEKKVAEIEPKNSQKEIQKEILYQKYGYVLNDFEVVNDTIHNGDSFGELLDACGVNRSKVFQIANTVKDSFNVARITSGKPYTILMWRLLFIKRIKLSILFCILRILFMQKTKQKK